MSTVIPIRELAEPSFDELIANLKRAKASHFVAQARFKSAQAELDAAYDVVAKASRAVGEHVDKLTKVAS